MSNRIVGFVSTSVFGLMIVGCSKKEKTSVQATRPPVATVRQMSSTPSDGSSSSAVIAQPVTPPNSKEVGLHAASIGQPTAVSGPPKMTTAQLQDLLKHPHLMKATMEK